MKSRLAIDRFDGLRKELAVLITADGRSFVFPRELLPSDSQEGEVLTFEVERDLEATAELRRQAHALRQDLGRTDPGGDIAL